MRKKEDIQNLKTNKIIVNEKEYNITEKELNDIKIEIENESYF